MSNIGINGFGRIGRNFFRRCLRKKAQVKAINDPNMKREYMAYLLKHDSTIGRLKTEIKIDEKFLIVDGMEIRVFNEKDPAEIRWGDAGVEYVIESSGKFTSMEDAKKHLKDSVRKVIISSIAPSVPTFVCGVNLEEYSPDMKVISNASCTTNCMAPLLKLLNEKFEIEEGLATTIHALTSNQPSIDGISTKESWNFGRGAMQNVIPTSTGSAKALCRILPELSGKINAMSFRVPMPNVSTLDLTLRFSKPANFDYLKELIKEAAEENYKGIIRYVDDDSVSSDFLGSTASCIFDAKYSMALNDKFYKFIAWYDNEFGYSCRLLDLLNFVQKVDAKDDSKDQDAEKQRKQEEEARKVAAQKEQAAKDKAAKDQAAKAEEAAQKCMAALDEKNKKGGGACGGAGSAPSAPGGGAGGKKDGKSDGGGSGKK